MPLQYTKSSLHPDEPKIDMTVLYTHCEGNDSHEGQIHGTKDWWTCEPP